MLCPTKRSSRLSHNIIPIHCSIAVFLCPDELHAVPDSHFPPLPRPTHRLIAVSYCATRSTLSHAVLFYGVYTPSRCCPAAVRTSKLSNSSILNPVHSVPRCPYTVPVMSHAVQYCVMLSSNLLCHSPSCSVPQNALPGCPTTYFLYTVL